MRLFRALQHNVEVLFWSGGLLYLAVIDPNSGNHLSFCVLKNLGFTYCPGCGLGTSISDMLHGDFGLSLSSHPLGMFALVIIVHRIGILLKPFFSPTNYQSLKGYVNGKRDAVTP